MTFLRRIQLSRRSRAHMQHGIQYQHRGISDTGIAYISSGGCCRSTCCGWRASRRRRRHLSYDWRRTTTSKSHSQSPSATRSCAAQVITFTLISAADNWTSHSRHTYTPDDVTALTLTLTLIHLTSTVHWARSCLSSAASTTSQLSSISPCRSQLYFSTFAVVFPWNLSSCHSWACCRHSYMCAVHDLLLSTTVILECCLSTKFNRSKRMCTGLFTRCVSLVSASSSAESQVLITLPSHSSTEKPSTVLSPYYTDGKVIDKWSQRKADRFVTFMCQLFLSPEATKLRPE